jgi:site-specific DNA-methyltransferase (adenine-specific)
MKPYFEKNNVTLYKENSFEVMDHLIKKNKKFDTIFADPPYFLSNDGITCINGKMVKVNKGDWDKSRGVEQNYQFTFDWMDRCKKLLKDTGTLWVSGTFHIIYSVAFAAQKLDMKFLNNIVWEKPNPPPNLSCRYFTHSTETILWFGKEKKSKHKFNYKVMREINGNKQMKDVWRLTSPKKSEKSFGKHPTQKPIQLLDLILKASTDENSLVLDPFNGSGTTGVSCIKNKRKYIGIEYEKNFCELSKKRFMNEFKDLNSKLL